MKQSTEPKGNTPKKNIFKKLYAFLKSMQFGMILLLIVALFCVVGSLLQQNVDPSYYTMRYGFWGKVMLFLGLDHVYSNAFFLALFGLLFLNLSFCSINRIKKISAIKEQFVEKAAHAPCTLKGNASALQTALLNAKFKKKGHGYVKNSLGFYGSILTHIGFLLLIIGATFAFTLETKTLLNIPVGTSVALQNQDTLTVNAFQMENEKGDLDYKANLTLTTSNGETQTKDVSVNNPAHMGNYTFFQQTYNRSGVLAVSTSDKEQGEIIVLDAPSFISLDGENGIQYLEAYGDHVVDGNGKIAPLNRNDGRIVNPVYLIEIRENGETKRGLTNIDETFHVGGVYFTFKTPQMYPGILVKTLPSFVLPFLYFSFVVLILGLYFCFFTRPVSAYIKDNALSLAFSKESGDLEQDLIDQLKETLKEQTT